MRSLFSARRTHAGDVRGLALGLWISRLLRRDGDHAHYRNVLAEAVALREAARGVSGPALLAAYIMAPAPEVDATLHLDATAAPTGWTLHLPHRAKADPRQISLGHLIQINAIQRNSAEKLRHATARIGAAKIAALNAAPPTKHDWRAEATEAQRAAPVETLAFATTAPTGWTLHLPHRAKADPRQISLGHLIHANAIQGNSAEKLRRATAQLGATKIAALQAPPTAHDWRIEAAQINREHDLVLILPSRRWYKYGWYRRDLGIAAEQHVSDSTTDFIRTLIAQLGRSEQLTTFFAKTGQTLPASGLLTTRFADVVALAQQQPERAALALLFHLHKALCRYDAAGLMAALSICQKLLLAPQFSAAVATIAAIWRKAQAPQSHVQALDLLLEGTGWNWAAALTPESAGDPTVGYDDLWTLGKIAWAQRAIGNTTATAVQHRGYWVVCGKLPYAWVGRLPVQDLTLVSLGPNALTALEPTQIDRLRPPNTTTQLETGRNLLLPHYSSAEDALSQRTARLAHLLTTAVSEIVGPELSQDWFPTLDLVVDDLLFTTTREFWSLLHHLCHQSAASKGVFCATADLTGAFEAGLEALGCSGQVQLVEAVDSLDADSPRAPLNLRLYGLLHASLTRSDEAELRQGIERVIMETNVAAGPSDAALLIGRRYDRNYKTDLAALGNAIQEMSRAVIFMPTAVGGLKGRVNSLLESEAADWYSDTFHQAATALSVAPPISWVFGKKGILFNLLEHLHRRGALDLLDLALILVARQRLEKFYAEKFLRYIEVGTMVSHYVSATRPAYLALMPGRDFIARVAAVAARRHRIPSFDVQTVFVGARSRYKRTLADVQLTIETESQRLFQSYFDLASERTILSGCAKVGIVRQQGQDLNRNDVRAQAGLGSRFHLVFAGSPFLDADQPILETLARGLVHWPDACLGIRLHPTAPQNFADYCAQLAQTHANVAVLAQLNLPQTLVSADILITRFSNVGLEAGLLNRDVIACNFSQEPAPIRLDVMGVASAATNANDLLACIEDFRRHGPRWDNLQNTRQRYHQNNPQMFVDSSPDYMRELMEQFVAARGIS